MGRIIVADALDGLCSIEAQSCDMCVTSPPYYHQRDYGTPGQIGLEETPAEYIARLVIYFREVRRVLRDDGTLWLNIGDTYSQAGRGGGGKQGDAYKVMGARLAGPNGGYWRATPGYKPKDLIGIPWMLAFALRDDGWFLRQDIIWHKPNCMPESVRDRCTKAHEYLFLMSKSERYYFDSDAIKEPCVGFDNRPVAGSTGAFGSQQSRRRRGNAKTFRGGGAYTQARSIENSAIVARESRGNTPNETGLRNRRSVWTIATRPFAGAHFATFPPELVRPCILAGSRPGGTVVDPFCGSGTVGEVAQQEGRDFIGIDINPVYGEMTKERLGG